VESRHRRSFRRRSPRSPGHHVDQSYRIAPFRRFSVAPTPRRPCRRTTRSTVGYDWEPPATDHAAGAAQVSAAVLMSLATSSGWETIATWLEGTSMVVAPMRLANRRSASGGIASSCVATRYQDGSDFQAGTAHDIVEGRRGQGLLNGVHRLCLHRVDVAREVLHEVVLSQPGEAPLVGEEVYQCRGWRALRQQRAERFPSSSPKAAM